MLVRWRVLHPDGGKDGGVIARVKSAPSNARGIDSGPDGDADNGF